jgi:hypothetical protein
MTLYISTKVETQIETVLPGLIAPIKMVTSLDTGGAIGMCRVFATEDEAKAAVGEQYIAVNICPACEGSGALEFGEHEVICYCKEGENNTR